MAKLTHISWADSTLNIWMGCQETGSPACVGCYARQLVETRFKRTVWGPHGERVETKDWRGKLREISREAIKAGRPWFVFVNSLSDFWDNKADPRLRAEALAEFAKYPHLTFLLLTKRPQIIVKLFAEVARIWADEHGALDQCWPKNVALGCTVVTQKEADRDIPHLLVAAAALQPAFAFLSLEPLVEAIDIAWAMSRNRLEVGAGLLRRGHFSPGLETVRRVGWVITGGATDQGQHKAFATPLQAFRSVRDQCADADVPYHHKQNGEHLAVGQVTANDNELVGTSAPRHIFPDGEIVYRVGKKVAGRQLDGAVHDARPQVTHAA